MLLLLSVSIVHTTLSAKDIYIKVMSLSNTAFSKEQLAVELSKIENKLNSMNYDIYSSKYGNWDRVYAGPFASRLKAEKALKNIKSTFRTQSYILEFEAAKSSNKVSVSDDIKTETLEIVATEAKIDETKESTTNTNDEISTITTVAIDDNKSKVEDLGIIEEYKEFPKAEIKEKPLKNVNPVITQITPVEKKIEKVKKASYKEKVTLKGNMIIKFNQLPSSVNSVSDIFSEGMFYGRLRSNIFMWDWNDDSKFDNKAMGLGGSFVYKTAPYAGLSATAGLYTSQNPSFFREEVADLGSVKAGKDTLSRHATTTSGNYGMAVLGQAYLQYDLSKTSFKIGRQMLETVFTKSNDTKMIPNTFDGITATIKEIPKTNIQLAYLDKQKLRDHTNSHDVLAVDGWNQNDDSAINKNLTVARIGNDNSLIVASVTNKSIKNLKVNVSYAMVPDVVSNLTLESHYTIPVVGEWKIAPGVRYMQQIDNLGADYDVANLKKNHTGYTDAKSLDSSLLALRLDIKTKAFLARLGYSTIADEADIVAPWRGFPTGGFTRAMAQYNWYANTKTYMARVGYDFSKAKIVDGFSIMARYAIQDFDDNKAGVQADTNILHIDVRQNIGKNLQAKLRLGFVSDEDEANKADVSYNEYRFELNYFF